MKAQFRKKSFRIADLYPFLLPLMLLLALFVVIFQSQHGQSTNTHAQVSICIVPSADLTQDSEEQKLLQLVNTYRQQNGLPTLKLSAALIKAATWQSLDMANHNYLAHADSLGRQPNQRLTDCGYNTFNVANGENIAGNTTDANTTFTQWKNSPVHNANMLTRTFIVAGISRSYNANSTLKWYWVLDFGGQDDSSVTPSQAVPSQAQPSQTLLPTNTPPAPTPTPTQSNYCLGACITPTPTSSLTTPSQSINQPTDTPMSMPSSAPISIAPVISSVPITSQPGQQLDNKSILTLLLGIIALFLEFLRKLF